MKRKRCAATIFLAAILLWNRPTHAHKMNLFATREGERITGSAYAGRGAPLREVTVHILDPETRTLQTNVVTGSDGRFSFSAAAARGYLLQIDLGDGHRAEWRVEGQPGTVQPGAGRGSDPGGIEAPGVEPTWADIRIVQTQIGELREQLTRYEDHLRIQDILGGIGYLFGLAGVAFYFLGRNRAST